MPITPDKEKELKDLLAAGDALGMKASQQSGVKYPTVVSSSLANKAATQAVTDYQSMQTANAAISAANKPAEAAKTTPATLVHPETLDEVGFQDPLSNSSTIKSYVGQGYTFDATQLPNGITPPGADPKAVKDDQEYRDLIGELDSYRSKLSANHGAYIDSLKGVFSERKKKMEDINMRQLASNQAFGFGTGAQRSLSFQGILTETETQGLDRLRAIDAEEAKLKAQAEEAYLTNDFQALSKKMDAYWKNRESKEKELENLQKAALEHNKLLTEQAATLEKDFKKSVSDIAKDAAANMAPSNVIQAIMSAQDLGGALVAAGNYLQSGSGVVGEYLFYKREAQVAGQQPVDFNTFQNIDANRKASIAAATGSSGLNSKQTQNFLRITDKFQADPFINNALKGATAIQIADQVIANPNNAANQLKSLYVLVKNLDPDSAVREGEISLADKTQSYLQRFQTSLARVQSGQVISPDAAVLLAEATKDLASAWATTAEKRKKQYIAQAAGADVSTAFDEYLAASEMSPSTSQQIIDGHQSNPAGLELGADPNNPLGI